MAAATHPFGSFVSRLHADSVTRSLPVKTQVIPGSHKSNIIHPAMDSGGGKIEYDSTDPGASDAFASAVEVHQKAGDVLLFVRVLC